MLAPRTAESVLLHPSILLRRTRRGNEEIRLFCFPLRNPAAAVPVPAYCINSKLHFNLLLYFPLITECYNQIWHDWQLKLLNSICVRRQLWDVPIYSESPTKKKNQQTPWSEFASELYLPTYRLLSEKLVPTFADRGRNVVTVADPYSRILIFLDRSRYFFLQVASQLYSRGWVDPIPDPLLLRKSGSARNHRKPTTLFLFSKTYDSQHTLPSRNEINFINVIIWSITVAVFA
jgi:hypothetical protein